LIEGRESEIQTFAQGTRAANRHVNSAVWELLATFIGKKIPDASDDE
jgi:hypothetical protein